MPESMSNGLETFTEAAEAALASADFLSCSINAARPFASITWGCSSPLLAHSAISLASAAFALFFSSKILRSSAPLPDREAIYSNFLLLYVIKY
jgi:hypothetical protein